MLAFKRRSGQDSVNMKGLVSFVFRSYSSSEFAKYSFKEFQLFSNSHSHIPSFHSLGDFSEDLNPHNCTIM